MRSTTRNTRDYRARTRLMRGCGAHGVHQLMRAEQAFCRPRADPAPLRDWKPAGAPGRDWSPMALGYSSSAMRAATRSAAPGSIAG
jgi:hypothetical protein